MMPDFDEGDFSSTGEANSATTPGDLDPVPDPMSATTPGDLNADDQAAGLSGFGFGTGTAGSSKRQFNEISDDQNSVDTPPSQIPRLDGDSDDSSDESGYSADDESEPESDLTDLPDYESGSEDDLAAGPSGSGNRPTLATWNMQGINEGEKWGQAARLVNGADGADVVALQEAGSDLPGTPGDNLAVSNGLQAYGRPQNRPGLRQNVRQYEPVVQQSQWQVGSSSQGRGGTFSMYRLQTDPNGAMRPQDGTGGRVNLVTVSRSPADEVAVVHNPVSSRPALGIRQGQTWYFNLHAQSGGGPDAPGLVTNISSFVNGRPQGEDWTAMGDFNRNLLDSGPRAQSANEKLRTSVNGLGAAIHNTGQATHQNGGELDYAVGTVPHEATVLAGMGSDHWPVSLKPQDTGDTGDTDSQSSQQSSEETSADSSGLPSGMEWEPSQETSADSSGLPSGMEWEPSEETSADSSGLPSGMESEPPLETPADPYLQQTQLLEAPDTVPGTPDTVPAEPPMLSENLPDVGV